MPSPDRTLSVLHLFTLESPTWTIEVAAPKLGVSVSSAYRYFAALCNAGLLCTEAPGLYVLGPAFIQYDRQIQITDTLLGAASHVMNELVHYAPEGTTLVLCRVFQDTVLCVHQLFGRGPQPLVSYERGRPMPLFRGATSKIILAYLPARHIVRLYAAQADQVAAAGLGNCLDAFKAYLAEIRRAGYAISHQEVDIGRAGIAAPILDHERRVLGSLSFIVANAKVDMPRIARLATLLVASAREIEGNLLERSIAQSQERGKADDAFPIDQAARRKKRQ